MVSNKNIANSVVWNSSTEEEYKNNNETESENEWTDIVVTEQGGLHTKTRKIQDDLEEPDWDKKVDDIIWEDGDEPSWKKKKKTAKKSTSTDNLTKMKDWGKFYNSTEKEDEKSKAIKKTLKRKNHLFGVDIDDNHHEWQIVFNLISNSRFQAVFCSILISFLAYLYSRVPLPEVTTKRSTISPITALTTSHSSVALMPKYPEYKGLNVYKHLDKYRELSIYKQLLTHSPVLTRNIRHLKHLGIVSDCATEIYSADSYLFIASCTFGIMIFRSSSTSN